MNTNQTANFHKEVEALRNLFMVSMSPEEMTRDLITIYMNYSRLVIGVYEIENDSEKAPAISGEYIRPVGKPNTQLYSLMQMIAVCDAGSPSPMLSDILSDANHSQLKTA